MWSTGAVLYCILSGVPPFSCVAGSESVGEKTSSKSKRAVKLVAKVVVPVVVQLFCTVFCGGLLSFFLCFGHY